MSPVETVTHLTPFALLSETRYNNPGRAIYAGGP